MDNKIGKKFKMLTVLERMENNKFGHGVYKVRCECGTEKTITSCQLNKTISCGCITKRKWLEPGTRVNMRTLIKQLDNDTVKIRCDCGNVKIINYRDFVDKRTKSCGCINGQSIKRDIANQRFGKLVALRETKTIRKKNKNSYASYIYWEFKCDCGNVVELYKGNVTSGKQISCGCYVKEKVRKTMGERTTFDNTNIHLLASKNRKPTSSGVVGVTKVKNTDKYNARISFQKKLYNMGNHDFEIAVALRKQAEEQIHGNFIKWYKENKEKIISGEVTTYK